MELMDDQLYGKLWDLLDTQQTLGRLYYYQPAGQLHKPLSEQLRWQLRWQITGDNE